MTIKLQVYFYPIQNFTSRHHLDEIDFKTVTASSQYQNFRFKVNLKSPQYVLIFLVIS
jgi:hypothetical protein